MLILSVNISLQANFVKTRNSNMFLKRHYCSVCENSMKRQLSHNLIEFFCEVKRMNFAKLMLCKI